MMNKFVIITNQRCGSNMLVSMLDNHPEIKCFGELMRTTPPWMKQDGYRGALRVLNKVDEAYKNDRHRFAYPHDFVREVFKAAPRNRKIYGFKLHLGQHPSFLSQLIHDPEWKVVVLERENKLAQFSSRKIVELTGQGNAPKGTEVKRATVEFKAREFAKFVEHERKEWERVQSEIKGSGKRSFSILYTELLSREAIRNLLEFLGVNPSAKLEPRTEKRNPSTILSRFSNKDEVAAELEKMGFAQWSCEVFAGSNPEKPDEGEPKA